MSPGHGSHFVFSGKKRGQPFKKLKAALTGKRKRPFFNLKRWQEVPARRLEEVREAQTSKLRFEFYQTLQRFQKIIKSFGR